jgi:hypothetical protein
MKLNLFLLSAAAMVNAASGELPVELGTAGDFVILAKTGISTVPASAVTGNIGVWPITLAAITGFNLAMHTSGMYSTDGGDQLNSITNDNTWGRAFAPEHTDAEAKLVLAVFDMEAAYTDATLRPTTPVNSNKPKYLYINHGAGDLGGKTLTPGVYTFDIDVIISTGNTLTFDGGGNANAVFVIQTTKSVKLATATEVILTNSAQAENIFWVVAQEVVVQESSHMKGVLLVKTGVTFITNSSLDGRIFAQTAATLQMATITEPIVRTP